MQRPGGEAPPQFRNGPPLPPGSGPRPGMMNMGRPYAPPPIQGRGPMMHQRPPFPHGQQQQQSPRFGPPQSHMLPPGNLVAPPSGQPMPAAPPPPNIALPSLGTMPSRPLTGPAAAGSPLPAVGPRGPLPLPGKQPLLPATLNLPQSPIINAPLSLGPPLLAAPVQVSQGLLTAPSLLSQPPRPKDDEIIRNIEILVQFVLKNGPEFENMARAKQAGNPKFSFLFGGELGSDAAIGYEYYQWLKRKSQLDQSAGREGEAKVQLQAPSVSPDSNQQHMDSKGVHLGGALTVSVVSDMEVDMDMEDDSVEPMLVTEDVKNFQATGRKEGEVWPSVDNEQGEKGETLSLQVKSLAAEGGNHIEASQLEFQKEKGKCLEPAFEVPCVEDVSPIRPLRKELQHSLTNDNLEAKSFPILKEDPPIASNRMAESDAMVRSVVGVGSETVKLVDNKSGEKHGREDIECQKLEADTAYIVKPDSALAPDHVKSEMGLHGKREDELERFDKYGRLMRRGNSDSESDDMPPTTKFRRDSSWSRSPSPGYDRWRKRSYSRSPRRKSRWSRSHSRSPKRRRSRSRTPPHNHRRGGDSRYDHMSRGRGTPPPCNDFAKGRCYRGASCKFLHHDVSGDNASRWAGGGRVRGRLENRQDVAKSAGSKDGFLSGELEKLNSISPERFFDGHDNRSFDERQNQESYKQNDCAPAPCFNFSKGRCYRGASCRYLHSETTADTGGRWHGSAKGRERTETRQDSTKSFSGRDSFGVGEMEREENNSPHRFRDDHYRHNFRERRSQEVDRPHIRSVPACIFFARGNCQKGPSCRFLHEDSSGQNVGARGREKSSTRAELTVPFGDKRFSGIAEMDRNRDIPLERTSDGQDRWDSLRHKTQEAHMQNASSANTVIKPQFSSPGREKSQPQREELPTYSMPTTDASTLHDNRENLELQFIQTKQLHSNSASWENVDAQIPQDGSGAESLRAQVHPDNSVTNLGLQPLQNSDNKFHVEHIHSNEDLHLTPLQPLPRDLPSHQHHAAMRFSSLSGQPPGSGGSSLSQHDTLQGMPLSHLNVAKSIDPLPPGYPLNSYYDHPHSEIAGSSIAYEPRSIATNPISTNPTLIPQPPPDHAKFVQEFEHAVNVHIDMPTTSAIQKPACSQTSLELELPNVSSTEQEALMQRPTSIPLLAPESKSGPAASAPFVLFGEHITNLLSHGVTPLTVGHSTINHPPQDISAGGDQHNPLSDTVEYSSGASEFLKKVPESPKVQDVKGVVVELNTTPLPEAVILNKDDHVKSGSPSKVQDIVEDDKCKDATMHTTMETDHQAVNTDMHAGINILENGSPAREGKNWSPGATGAADIDTDQAHVQDESKKSKEIRIVKQFRSVLAEFVKDVLKPTWREGHMSKEAFKTIVKKVVDKVAGSLQIHQIPKTQERIDQYLASSRPKLTKLVQGYVDKYVKS
ncbi:uncharacterized protein LOC131057751 isoform X2 [Cryptomeria japonica]|uniref:uncharacterized protein LOC131057751 isoform X2 n=1 Tax=Cryptomeria japonica TaxID=3369 RepID=UPI0027DA4A65|nr:uncharacterized protein LOC131057751 isoform X2 [Cryptomeria japonica]